MKFRQKGNFWIGGGIALILATSASGSPLRFDCDVPANHYSSVSQDIESAAHISGTIAPKEFRSGDNLPVAGARAAAGDDKNGTGFQLVASSAHAKELDIIINVRRDGNLTQRAVGKIGIKAPIAFDFSVSGTGQVRLEIGSQMFTAEAMPIASGRMSAFCSTGQFEFTGLAFSEANQPPSSQPAVPTPPRSPPSSTPVAGS